MRLTEHAVEQIIGQTPCLCGDIETWHKECYIGKTRAQIAAGYKRAFRIARAKIRSAQQREATEILARISARAAGSE